MAKQDDTQRLNRAFGEVVRGAREALGVSQEELGFESEFDRTYISGIERGVRTPTLRTIVRLGGALGVRPSVLLRPAEDRAGVEH